MMKTYYKPITRIVNVNHESLLNASVAIDSNSKEWFEGDNRSNMESSFNDQLW